MSLNHLNSTYKSALVTGGAGFIGSHLVDALLKQGLKVISLDDYSAGKRVNLELARGSDRFTEIEGDVCDKKLLKEILPKVDIIFHQACSKNTICMKNPSRDLEINADGTLGLLLGSVEHGVKKFVHASTGSVYGEPRVFPTDESHPLDPVSYYGVSKLAGERYVSVFHRLHKLDTTTLRYHHVFGPRQDNSDVGGVVSIFARNVVEGSPITIYGDGEQVRSFTYVSDVVAANLCVANQPESRGQTYNCASGIKVTIKDLAHKVRNYFEKPAHPIRYADWKPGDIIRFDVSNQKLKNLGYKFEWGFDQGFDETMKSVSSFIQDRQ